MKTIYIKTFLLFTLFTITKTYSQNDTSNIGGVYHWISGTRDGNPNGELRIFPLTDSIFKFCLTFNLEKNPQEQIVGTAIKGYYNKYYYKNDSTKCRIKFFNYNELFISVDINACNLKNTIIDPHDLVRGYPIENTTLSPNYTLVLEKHENEIPNYYFKDCGKINQIGLPEETKMYFTE